jgi:hypothetical protein
LQIIAAKIHTARLCESNDKHFLTLHKKWLWAVPLIDVIGVDDIESVELTVRKFFNRSQV